MKKIIMQVSGSLCLGGIETLVLEMQRNALPNAEVHAVSLGGSKQVFLETRPNFNNERYKTYFLNKGRGLNVRTIKKIIQLMRHIKASVVHTHNTSGLLYGGIAARLVGIKHHVHTEHDAWHLQNKKEYYITKTLFQLLKPKVVADASCVFDSLNQLMPKQELFLIYNGIDIDKFKVGDKKTARQLLQLPLDRKIIGCVGRLELIKGQEFLIQALKELPEEVYLIFVGQGSLQTYLEQQVKALGLTRQVRFLGKIENMTPVYQAIDVCCLPSLGEGLPLVLLEAQASGIPCVATDVGGTSEALCPHTGILVPPKKPQQLAQAIWQRLEEPPTISPRDFVVASRSLKEMMVQYHRLYEI